jgi:hypothetical protein
MTDKWIYSPVANLWIHGLLGLSSRRIKNAGVQEKY